MIEENKTLCEPLKYKQLRVKALLLTEIIAFRRTTKCPDLETSKDNKSHEEEESLYDRDFPTEEIFMHNGIIYSSQRYNSGPDPDMSDISVAFYEIIYNNTLHKESDSKSFSVLREYKKGEKLPNGETAKNPIYDFTNPDVAGDTMNSYNSVAKFASEDKRKEWYLSYHCLANFWLIPYSIGRTSMKWSNYDSLDLFLNAIKKNDNRMMTHPYFNYKKFLCETGIFCYGKFLDTHYLTGYTTLVKKEKCNEQYKDNSDKIINQMIECIELRADNIVRNEEICNKLYDFFKEKKLL